MKKKLFLVAFLSISIALTAVAQTSTTPEVPKSYKPQPKELLPMPDSMSEGAIFPVLGAFTVTDPEGNESHLTVTRDAENKGIVWVNGLPQGKFKAFLRDAPAIYKIPAQKTLANDEAVATETAAADAAEAETAPATTKKTKSKVISGRSIEEGTLIFDKEANTLFVNIGNKFNEEDPAAAFPQMTAAADVTEEGVAPVEATTAETEAPAKKEKPAKKPVIKGITYSGAKVTETVAATE